MIGVVPNNITGCSQSRIPNCFAQKLNFLRCCKRAAVTMLRDLIMTPLVNINQLRQSELRAFAVVESTVEFLFS